MVTIKKLKHIPSGEKGTKILAKSPVPQFAISDLGVVLTISVFNNVHFTVAINAAHFTSLEKAIEDYRLKYG